jgi:hypothetical protein
MYKSLFDSIEEALIQLQYAVADYYSCSHGVEALRALDAPFNELCRGASSAHLAIEALRANPKAGLVDKLSYDPR